jgi:hypothetical protein
MQATQASTGQAKHKSKHKSSNIAFTFSEL